MSVILNIVIFIIDTKRHYHIIQYMYQLKVNKMCTKVGSVYITNIVYINTF